MVGGGGQLACVQPVLELLLLSAGGCVGHDNLEGGEGGQGLSG